MGSTIAPVVRAKTRDVSLVLAAVASRSTPLARARALISAAKALLLELRPDSLDDPLSSL